MRYVTTIVGCIVGLAVVLGVAVSAPERSSLNDDGHWPTGEAVINLPGGDDEDCHGPGSDDEADDTPGCFISKAVVDVADPSTLTLEGRFCDEPEVFLGSAGGALQPLFLVSSGASFIQADLSPWNDPATRIVVVRCPCDDCVMDLTIGTQGPTGPTGPTGPVGEIPAGTGSVQVIVQSSHFFSLDENITCVSAECPPDRVVTGGGFLVLDTNPGGSEPDFQLAAAGPLVPDDYWDLYDSSIMDIIGQARPASQKWTVCGSGSSAFVLVQAVCLRGTPPTCGDGQISPPEVCETHEDCQQLFGNPSQCVDCTCRWCGDGVVTTPPEECETDSDCGIYQHCQDCYCVVNDDPYGDGGSVGD